MIIKYIITYSLLVCNLNCYAKDIEKLKLLGPNILPNHITKRYFLVAEFTDKSIHPVASFVSVDQISFSLENIFKINSLSSIRSIYTWKSKNSYIFGVVTFNDNARNLNKSSAVLLYTRKINNSNEMFIKEINLTEDIEIYQRVLQNEVNSRSVLDIKE